jgi:hypothetical protein
MILIPAQTKKRCENSHLTSNILIINILIKKLFQIYKSFNISILIFGDSKKK